MMCFWVTTESAQLCFRNEQNKQHTWLYIYIYTHLALTRTVGDSEKQDSTSIQRPLHHTSENKV